MNWTAFFVILFVIGFIFSNIMLVKYTAHFKMKNINQDPIEKAKQSFKEREEKEQIKDK